MKKLILTLALLIIAPALFAQEWRDRAYRPPVDNAYELTPMLGYRWGGTIYGDQTSIYGHKDVDLDSSLAYGLIFGIPVSPSGIKIELMINRQDTEVGKSGGLFEPSGHSSDFSVTYYHAGALIPFGPPHGIVPYGVFSAGIATLDPHVSGVSSSNDFSMSGGFGVKVPINHNVSFRGEFRGYYTATSNTNSSGCHCDYSYDYYSHDLFQGEATAGLAIRF